MRNFAAFIGVAIGGYVGWLIGTVADTFSSWLTQTQPGYTFTVVAIFLMATLWAYTFWDVAGELHTWHTARKLKVERAEMEASPTPTRTGRTPPGPFLAFQA